LTQTGPIGILCGQYPSHRSAPERAARPVRKTKVTASVAGPVNNQSSSPGSLRRAGSFICPPAAAALKTHWRNRTFKKSQNPSLR
jgi:hypothetical protein